MESFRNLIPGNPTPKMFSQEGFHRTRTRKVSHDILIKYLST
jgi:hypothetical protein